MSLPFPSTNTSPFVRLHLADTGDYWDDLYERLKDNFFQQLRKLVERMNACVMWQASSGDEPSCCYAIPAAFPRFSMISTHNAK